MKKCLLQYVVHFHTNPDLFEHILPICIEERNMMSFEEEEGYYEINRYKLVILKNINHQSIQWNRYSNYQNEMYKSRYTFTQDEAKLYKDVAYYIRHIKHKYEGPEHMNELSTEKIQKIEQFIQRNDLFVILPQDIDSDYDENNEYEDKDNTLKRYRRYCLMKDPLYYQQIVEFERNITNVVFSEETLAHIQRVVNHPKLTPFIKYHGVEAVVVDF